MSDGKNNSIWGALSSAWDILSGRGSLSDDDVDAVSPDVDSVHNARASHYGFLESDTGHLKRPTLADTLFLGPENTGEQIGNIWDYGDRIGHHLPRSMPQDELENRLIPDFGRNNRRITYLERAKELRYDHLLPDPEDMKVIRKRHWENLSNSFLTRMQKAFSSAGLLGEDGVTLVFAGVPILPLRSEHKRFITLNWTPQDWSLDRALWEGWTTGHVSANDFMKKYEYILILPPFQERQKKPKR